MERQELGKQGEEAAARFLLERGYEILARNYRCRWGELDLVAVKDGVIAFVEVRTWFSGQFGPPEESITYRKRRHLIDAAFSFLGGKGGQEWNWQGNMRFDLVTVRRVKGELVLRHYPGVF